MVRKKGLGVYCIVSARLQAAIGRSHSELSCSHSKACCRAMPCYSFVYSLRMHACTHPYAAKNIPLMVSSGYEQRYGGVSHSAQWYLDASEFS